MEQCVEDLFYDKYRSSVARLRVSAHFFPIETGRMINKPSEQRMCPLCLNKRDEHHYILKCTHPKFIPIRTKFFEAIFELADQNTYRYESKLLKQTLVLCQFRIFNSKRAILGDPAVYTQNLVKDTLVHFSALFN